MLFKVNQSIGMLVCRPISWMNSYPDIFLKEGKTMEMVRLQIQILIFLAIGLWFGKKQLISRQSANQLNGLVMNLILPCSIFHAFQTKLTAEILNSTLSILILAILIQVVFIVLSRWMWRFVSDDSERINLEYGTVSNNAGTLGMVIGQAAFGQEGVLYTSIYAIPLRIVMWSYGLLLYNRSHTVNYKELLAKVVRHPCMIAIFLGILTMIAQSFGYELPTLVTQTVSSLGGCNTVLIMIIIGVILSEVPLKDLFAKYAIIYTVFRLVIFPLLVLGALMLFGVDGMPLKICVLESAMPAPVTMAMLSQKYDCNAKFSSKMIFLSTACSMVSLPVWTILLSAL